MNIQSKAVLVSLSIGMPGNSRQDAGITGKVITQEHFGQQAGRWLKALIKQPTPDRTPTPRPWFLGDSGLTIGSNNPDYECIANLYNAKQFDEKAYANGDLIVRAVNCHDELLAALKALTDWGRTYTSPLQPNTPHELLIAAVQAIKKAEPNYL